MIVEIGTHMVLIRPARPGDAAAAGSMFDRCSQQTRYRRFHGFVTGMPPAYLRRCLDCEPPAQNARVAELLTGVTPGGTANLVGLASAGPVPGQPHVHEAGALVEDGWQRRGIGRMLVAGLFADAYATGVELIRLELCRTQPSLLAYVLAHARVASAHSSGCDMTVDVTVPAPAIGTRGAPFTRSASRAGATVP
jgi:hypothetical protein